MRGIRVVREKPCRNPDHAGNDVGLRVGKRGAVGIEDVGVEERRWIAHDRVADPRDVPDPVEPIHVRRAAEPAETGRERPRHDDGECERKAACDRSTARARRDGIRTSLHVECGTFYRHSRANLPLPA